MKKLTEKEHKENVFERDLVAIYEIVTGFFEGVIGLGLLILIGEIVNFYVVLQLNGVLSEHHEVLFNFTQKIVPYIIKNHLVIGTFLVATALVKIVSGIGILKRKLWAHYLLEIYLILLIPIDGIGMILHRPTLVKTGFLVFNILILLYLSGFKTPKTILHLKERFLRN